MSKDTKDSGSVIWLDRPWILPAAIIRTVLVLVVVIIIIWLETIDNAVGSIIIGLPLWMWTGLLFFVVWLISFISLLLLRTAHKYTLRSESLEVRTGIASLNSFVLAPSGFSDLEVNQSLVGRMLGYGDIVVHTQSDRMATMQRVRSPVTVANQIRDIMGKPIVRIEGQPPPQPPAEKK
jgi:uncharacterized membrane protein YdbT with pleckstrin-like domain